MTISQRERRVLDAIDGELSRDATLARLVRLFTGPMTTPPDVWLGPRQTPHRPTRTRPTRLFVVLILAVALGAVGTVLGVVLNFPVLADASLAIVFVTAATIRAVRRRPNAKTLPAQRN
jgi:heme A synthase